MGGELTGYVGIDLTGKGMQGARKRVGVNEYVYMQVPASTAKGVPLVVTYDGDEEVMVHGVAPATLAVYQEIGVTPRLAGSDAEFMWCQVRGIVQALVGGTTDVAKDSYLEILNTATAFVTDSTARSVNSVAIANEAYTDTPEALKSVQLTGDRVIVAAS